MSFNECESRILTLIKEVRSIREDEKYKLSDVALRRDFTEGWFSDSLAWLLDPKADHGLGVRFAQEFLKLIEGRTRLRRTRLGGLV